MRDATTTGSSATAGARATRPGLLGGGPRAREGIGTALCSRCQVTEEEWTAGEDPDALLDAAKAMKRLPARKARLFAGSCFRLVWDLIRADDIRLAVEMSDSRA